MGRPTFSKCTRFFGKKTCRKYFSPSQLRYDNENERRFMSWIQNIAVDISVRSGKHKITPAARRVSARKLMKKHWMIIILRPENVLSYFFIKNYHSYRLGKIIYGHRIC